MKNGIALLLAGLAFSGLAWVFWHYTGEYGFTILIVITIAALAARSARERREKDGKR